MTNNEQPERRRRFLLATPGEAERPGAYVPPTIEVIRISVESFMLDSPTTEKVPHDISPNDTDYKIQDEMSGDVWVSF
jgi:hypothetical protein